MLLEMWVKLAWDSDPSPLRVLDRCLLKKPESLFQNGLCLGPESLPALDGVP